MCDVSVVMCNRQWMEDLIVCSCNGWYACGCFLTCAPAAKEAMQQQAAVQQEHRPRVEELLIGR
jgi:hypothetical protein